MSEDAAAREFEATATHDSRNVLRGCMGPDGRVDVDALHAPLLLIGGEADQIIPTDLTEKNKAYSDEGSVTAFERSPDAAIISASRAGRKSLIVRWPLSGSMRRRRALPEVQAARHH